MKRFLNTKLLMSLMVLLFAVCGQAFAILTADQQAVFDTILGVITDVAAAAFVLFAAFQGAKYGIILIKKVIAWIF